MKQVAAVEKSKAELSLVWSVPDGGEAWCCVITKCVFHQHV